LGLVSVAIVERIVFVPIEVTGGEGRKRQQLFYNFPASTTKNKGEVI
jgi:hypothetical protein